MGAAVPATISVLQAEAWKKKKDIWEKNFLPLRSIPGNTTAKLSFTSHRLEEYKRLGIAGIF